MRQMKNQKLLKQVQDFIFEVNRDGVFLHFIAGKPENISALSKKFLGKKIPQLLPKELTNPIMECVRRAFRTKGVESADAKFNVANIYHHFRVRIAPNGDNKFLVLIRDVTHQRVVEEKLIRLNSRINTIIESITDGFIAIDEAWNYIYVNDHAARLSNNHKEDLIGKNVFKVHEDFEDTIFYKKYLEAMESKKVVKFEKYYPFLDSWYFITVYPSYDGISVYFSDITLRKQTDQKLRDSEERYRSMVEHVKDYAIFMLDAEGKVATWNDGAKRIFGYSSKEIMGVHFSRFYLEADIKKGIPDKELKTARQKGRYEDEGLRVRKNGTTFWCNVVTTIVRDELGAIKGFTKVVRDVTVQKKTAEKLQEQSQNLETTKDQLYVEKSKAEALLSSIGEAVIATDEHGKVTYVNPQALTLFGWKEDEVYNQYYYELLIATDDKGKDVPEWNQAIVQCLKTGSKISDSSTAYSTKNRKKFPAAVTATPLIFNKKIIGSVSVFRDIRKEKEIDRAKSEFVSLASHQLRTPLTAIKLFVEMLQDGGLGKLTDEQLDTIKSIGESNEKMIKLVENLLNISRLETGRLEIRLEDVELKNFVEKIVEDTQPVARYKGTKIDFHPSTFDAFVSTDQNLMRQVILNLINNAIQYSPKNNSKVTVVLDQRDDKSFVIQVKDKGIGIAKEYQTRIFDRFYRAPNAIKTHTDGNGLGLYMCKMITEALGGKIWLESEENKGTTFYVTLPMRLNRITK